MAGEAGGEDGFGEGWGGEDEACLGARPLPQPLPGGERGLTRHPRKPFTRWTADTENAFLLALRLTGQAKRAAAEIGRSSGAAQRRRLADPGFAARWDEAIAGQQAEWIAATQTALGPGLDDAGGGRLTPEREREGVLDARTRGLFLRTLKRTKNVGDACEAAGVSQSGIYGLKSRSPRFAAAWAKALAEDAASVLDAARARAVEGWDEPIVRGGEIIGHRRRYSDGLLRDLLRHELGGKGGPHDPDAGRATDAELNETILKNLALLEEPIQQEDAARHDAEWERGKRLWGNWARVSSGEMAPELPPEEDREWLAEEPEWLEEWP